MRRKTEGGHHRPPSEQDPSVPCSLYIGGFFVLSTLLPMTPQSTPPTTAPITPPLTLLRLVVAPITAPAAAAIAAAARAAAPSAASRALCFTATSPPELVVTVPALDEPTLPEDEDDEDAVRRR